MSRSKKKPYVGWCKVGRSDTYFRKERRRALRRADHMAIDSGGNMPDRKRLYNLHNLPSDGI